MSSELKVTKVPDAEVAMGRCASCEARAMLAWVDEDLGRVCRQCAGLFLTLELEARFSGAWVKTLGGGEKR
jgi:hypothetical protein